jgi:hypothetical protein
LTSKKLTDVKLDEAKEPSPVTSEAPKSSILGGFGKYFSAFTSKSPHPSDIATKHAKNNSEMLVKG